MSEQDPGRTSPYRTAREMAEFLRIPADTLTYLRLRKGLPGHRFGRRVVYLESEVLAWFEDRERRRIEKKAAAQA